MRKLGAVLVLVWMMWPALSLAQGSYPNRPIRMIVPFAPGGASDFVARIISPKLSEALAQQIVVDNRAGASGNIGMEAAAKAPADGYTIFLGNIGTIAINPGIFPTLPVNPVKDFIAITLVSDVPSILVANPSVRVNSVAELVALARSKPGELNFASPGSSTLNRLEMEQFMKAANVSIVHIPYKGGAGPAVIGLLGGETQGMFVTVSSAISFIHAVQLKALGVSAHKRVGALPHGPPLAQAGEPEKVSRPAPRLVVPPRS